MIGAFSDMSPGLLTMYGLLAWTAVSVGLGRLIGAGMKLADKLDRAQADHDLAA